MIFVDGYNEELIQYVKCNAELFQKCKEKTFLITGAAGLIGSYLVDLLLEANQKMDLKAKIYAVDQNKVLLEKRFPDKLLTDGFLNLIVADVNEELEFDFPADYVIHAASNTSPTDYATKPINTICTNIMGTDRLLQYCVKQNSQRFLFCSSVEAYGRNNGDVDDFSEDYSGYVDSNSLRAGYPSAKRASEALCNAYKKEYPHISFAIARIGRIYGPTVIPGDSKAPSQFIYNAVNGEDIILKSAGTQMYSFAYVGDCAIGMLYILLNGTDAEAYNIADSGSKIPLKDLAMCAAQAGGTKVVFQEQTAIEKASYSTISKATMDVTKLESIGWKAKFHTQEGIARTVRYLKMNGMMK